MKLLSALLSFAIAALPARAATDFGSVIQGVWDETHGATLEFTAGRRSPTPHLDALEREQTRLAGEAKRGVVAILVTATLSDKKPSKDAPDEGEEGSTHGSGFIVDAAKGLIVTNAHVVELVGRNDKYMYKDPKTGKRRTAYVLKSRLAVVLDDKTQVEGKMVHFEAWGDLALIKIEAPKKRRLRALRIDDAKDVKVGQWAMTVGAPIDSDLNNSVVFGMISGIHREVDPDNRDMIQTQAMINPGNSGGPLINKRGRVIGVNTSGLTADVGVGFSIPGYKVKAMMKRFLAGPRSHLAGIGLTTEETTQGLEIEDIQPDTPASSSGIKVKDVIVSVDEIPLSSEDEADDDARRRFWRVIRSKAPGDTVRVKVLRFPKAPVAPPANAAPAAPAAPPAAPTEHVFDVGLY
ncbi:MAG: trypsin-like peptidase domain-containing protein [Elusimicrobia bacterium]|nr:trypsin-like peptidase domain-containing protein [Elusimicrobiota bacterium]